MAIGEKVSADLKLALCSTSFAQEGTCHVTQAGLSAGIGGTVTSFGTSLGLEGSIRGGEHSELVVDPTLLSPVQVSPLANDSFNGSAALVVVPVVIDIEGNGFHLATKKKGNEIEPTVSFEKQQGGDQIVPYVAVGRISVKPDKGGLTPPIDNKFTGTSVDLDLPATFAARGGVNGIPAGIIRCNFGAGLGTGGAAGGGDSYSFVGSCQIPLTDQIKLRLGMEHSVLKRPRTLDQFLEGDGSTRTPANFYSALEWGRVTLWAGKGSEQTEELKPADMQNPTGQKIDHSRTMFYGAITATPFTTGSLKDLQVGVMDLRQHYSDETAAAVTATGNLTSLQLSHPVPGGFSLTALFFWQSASGQKIEPAAMPAPDLMPNPPESFDFSNKGFQLVLAGKWGN